MFPSWDPAARGTLSRVPPSLIPPSRLRKDINSASHPVLTACYGPCLFKHLWVGRIKHLWVGRIKPIVQMRKQRPSANAGLSDAKADSVPCTTTAAIAPHPHPQPAHLSLHSHSRVVDFLRSRKGFAGPVEGTVQKDETGQAGPGEHDDHEGHASVVDQLWKEREGPWGWPPGPTSSCPRQSPGPRGPRQGFFYPIPCA